MASHPETAAERKRPRVLIAIEDEAVRRRVQGLLGSADLETELLDPGTNPLRQPPSRRGDLLVVVRSDVKPHDLRLVDEYANEKSRPGLVVLCEEADDADRARLMAAGASRVLETQDTNRELRESLEALAEVEVRDAAPRLVDFLSRSPRMQRFLDLVQRVVDTDSSLLITGETGVGKERLAQAIHEEGARANGPFIAVNCGAIPEQLLESELFGHEAGAFTGARRRQRGRFEQAEGGTIFLDEVGEMPTHLQVKLLTVLQRRKVQRVGSEATVGIDVRVMAATNRDVVEAIRAGRFREDLYYRLNVVTLDIPPLRERPEDIPDLTGRFISRFRETLRRPRVEDISDEALGAMLEYDWPGNVRELENAVEHAVVLCRSSRITVADLPDTVAGREPKSGGASATRVHDGPSAAHVPEKWLALPLRAARQEVSLSFERDYLDALLARTAGVIADTAALAGITPRSLYDKMKRHGLRKEDYR